MDDDAPSGVPAETDTRTPEEVPSDEGKAPTRKLDDSIVSAIEENKTIKKSETSDEALTSASTRTSDEEMENIKRIAGGAFGK